MGNKRAQAAMEFLMTYGWAILIVLVALAALFFLGVFNPRTTNTCLVPAPFTCTDVKLTSTTGTLSLYLGASGTFQVSPTVGGASAVVNGVATTAGGGAISTTAPAEITFTVAAPVPTVGSKFSGTANIGYTLSSGAQHNTTVQFSGVAE